MNTIEEILEQRKKELDELESDGRRILLEENREEDFNKLLENLELQRKEIRILETRINCHGLYSSREEFKSRSSWHISPKLKEYYKNIIKDYILVLENNPDHYEVLELGAEQINPYQVGEILQELGYDWEYKGDNGWEQDTWYECKKYGCKPLTVEHSGIIFDLKIYCKWSSGGYDNEVIEYWKTRA